MQNICLEIAYDGSNYYGFQEQDPLPSIGGELRGALEDIVGHPLRLIAAGRTDKGVHAACQIVNFLTSSKLAASAFKYRLNDILPPDIFCKSSFQVPKSFHARFDSSGKEYIYRLERVFLNPIFRNFTAFYSFPLDLEKMQEVAQVMEGEHDFSAFSIEESHRSCKRLIYKCQIEESGSLLIFRIGGDSFLRRQVRIMIGSLLLVGRGKLRKEEIEEALDKGKKIDNFAAPACGLSLDRVIVSPKKHLCNSFVTNVDNHVK